MEDNHERQSTSKHDFLPADHAKRREQRHKTAEQENKSEEAKNLSPRGKTEKPRVPDFPWKWDWPPLERQVKRKNVSKLKRNVEKDEVTQDKEGKLKALNDQISWIFDESSESEAGSSTENIYDKNDGEINRKGPFDESFRNHLVKELLKQGKDVKWFVAGAQEALDNLQKDERANEPGIKSACRVTQELNQFLTKSMRPYYQEKKKEKINNEVPRR